MDDHTERLCEAVRALTIHSPNIFSWFGSRTQRSRRERVEGGDTFEWLQLSIQRQLYNGFYCIGIAQPAMDVAHSDSRLVSRWIADLSAANRGHGCADAGWTLVDDRDGSAIVRKNGLTFEIRGRVPRNEKRSRLVTVRLPKEFVSFAPGFYTALGDQPLADREPYFRVYWNLPVGSARAFVRNTTELLNRRRIAFRLKVVDDPARFLRCDSAVIYLRRRDRAKAYAAIEFLLGVQSIKRNVLVPAFTKAIAPGVAIAEQPPHGESFGQNRTRTVAEALVVSYRHGDRDVARRFARVLEAFQSYGVDLRRPHLNSGSKDIYPCLM
ncbi:MAG TPA: T3SS effector HopA1 family protein [Gemmatimonadaceae bacterium]